MRRQLTRLYWKSNACRRSSAHYLKGTGIRHDGTGGVKLGALADCSNLIRGAYFLDRQL